MVRSIDGPALAKVSQQRRRDVGQRSYLARHRLAACPPQHRRHRVPCVGPGGQILHVAVIAGHHDEQLIGIGGTQHAIQQEIELLEEEHRLVHVAGVPCLIGLKVLPHGKVMGKGQPG